MITLNNETKNEVKRIEVIKVNDDNTKRKIIRKELTAKEQKSITSAILTRNKTTCKDSDIKLTVQDVSKYATCKTQASLIDCMTRNKSVLFNDIVNELVKLELCTNTTTAKARVLRHYKHDTNTRIIKRNALLNM